MEEAEQYGDRVALMRRGRARAAGTPGQLTGELRARRGDDSAPTLEDVFMDVAGGGPQEEGGEFRDVRRTRGTAFRVG
uniref:hypothetical protein n=1 Tax=Nonomuraea pusilla TaxID=46177 RepID=UPI000A4D6299|nr:hypothetical protein [Nonomuraea pusilla]